MLDEVILRGIGFGGAADDEEGVARDFLVHLKYSCFAAPLCSEWAVSDFPN